MRTYLDNILHPEGYHGHPGKSPFFEGWYFKLVDSTGHSRYAIIPGVSLSPGDFGPHCFVQTLDGRTGDTDYHVYPLDAFSANRHTLEIQVGPNGFGTQGMTLDLPGTKLNINGHLAFSGLQPWPVKWHTPGIMGWYAWVPFMECYHGVLSFDHELHGRLHINGTAVDFTGGRGYIEKDWGKSFPSGWVWMQSNHFTTVGTSFTASIAMIPWIGSSFRGFIVGLLHEGKLLRFATYTRAKTEILEIHPDGVVWSIRDPHYRLKIKAHRAVHGNLRGPSRQDMARRVPETLQAIISVKLTRLSDGDVLFDNTGYHGGLEIAGDLDTLMSQ
jgi:tocopherol cyclase